MRRRCAIVECYNRHDEVYLSTVYLLNQLDYEVHVFTTLRNRLKNSFVYTEKLNRKVHFSVSASDLLDPGTYDDFDLVVFNTFEGPAVLDAARKVVEKIPIIGFLHNASYVRSKPEYEFFIANNQCKFAVLAPYIQRDIADTVDALYMYPVFFYDRSVPRLPGASGKKRFCVQGYFDSTRRQYSLLVNALQDLRMEGRDDLEVYVMGRTFSRDFLSFYSEIKKRDLASYVRYAWKGIGYRTYYSLLNSVDYILPLVSPTSHPEYFLGKATSSVAAAIGFGKISVLDEKLAAFYGVEEASFTYADDLTKAMRAALEASDDDVKLFLDRLAIIKEKRLQQSMQQLKQSISQFTRTPVPA